MTNDTIGVDISKDHLDAHRMSDGASRRFSNDKAGHRAFLKWLGERTGERIVYEPTGPYHRALAILKRQNVDRTGWHTTGNLVWPKNITPILLPSRSPELNPVEQVWQYLRANYLSNRVFENYDAIIDAACDAWRNLIAQPQQITSIGVRAWAHEGHL